MQASGVVRASRCFEQAQARLRGRFLAKWNNAASLPLEAPLASERLAISMATARPENCVPPCRLEAARQRLRARCLEHWPLGAAIDCTTPQPFNMQSTISVAKASVTRTTQAEHSPLDLARRSLHARFLAKWPDSPQTEKSTQHGACQDLTPQHKSQAHAAVAPWCDGDSGLPTICNLVLIDAIAPGQYANC
eukprot:CAMPEP_0172832856 /NCGR_PEP_ID=MMETSP1075-20121228/23951_1 /TAXON_ID=2916 /ORGANISM="Ceratium fusus, Strain PA161109" /LENGTH=191 /DNA_ID=CAMNT_0013675519 /DNA_START=55 /DNA_END=630 /DNA_ORIENTATION=-